MAAGGRFYSCHLLPHHGIFGGVDTVIFFGSIDANRNSGHDAISIAPKLLEIRRVQSLSLRPQHS